MPCGEAAAKRHGVYWIRGNRTVARVLPRGGLVMVMVPWWASTSSLVTARPMPLPEIPGMGAALETLEEVRELVG